MNALEQEIRRLIEADGPISVSRYMSLCLTHPKHGYYMNRDPFGARGDFITAPEISQMFGELIGVWCAEVWRMMDSPRRLVLAELGPGRGTLMRDLLRAAKAVPDFHAALEIHFVEASPKLASLQRDLLQSVDRPLHWHGSTDLLPQEPMIVIANEFLDALPIDQLIKMNDGWHEWRIGIADEKLAFGADPDALPKSINPVPASRGEIFERRDYAPVQGLLHRIAAHGGAALFIDYGHAKSAAGDTLQALKDHQFVSLLENPGEADITSHVDFGAFGNFARKQGAHAHGPVTQRAFLQELGIELRAAGLKQGKTAETVKEIEAALRRLIDPSPGMGELFKVMAVTHPSLTLLPGFSQ